jgi:hypothetical protein
MNSAEVKRLLMKNKVLLYTALILCCFLVFSPISSEAQSEDGVILIEGTYENGFVAMEWDNFIPPVDDGNFCFFHYQAYSYAPKFNFVYDLAEGTFWGSVTGKTEAKEIGWDTTGEFKVTDITGTIQRSTDGTYWEFQGSGDLSLQFYGHTYCYDANGDQYPVERTEKTSGRVNVTGQLRVINVTWTWDPRITFDSGEQHFRSNCSGCEVGTWTPTDEFSVNLDCQPVTPQEEDPVNCNARVLNVKADEDIEYTWYVDSAKEADTTVGSWTWASAEKGVHDITVYVQGEGRNTEKTVTIEVGEEAELVAWIGIDPPIPVLEKGVTFTPRVEGAKANETLNYRWLLDGQVLCETEMCAWREALEGEHIVELEVRGEGERMAVEQGLFDVVTLVDENEAGFRIVGLGCNSGVSSDETLVCNLGLERDEGVGPFNVTWLIDGQVASTEAGVQDGSEMQLGQPTPGEHVVSVVVVEPVDRMAISGQTMAEVVEGKNALIPPLAQAGAAGGTLGLVGVWLWAEWMNARRAEAEEARLRQLQKPSWVDDKRSLEEIWAADVEAERRRGLDLWEDAVVVE